MVSDGTVSWIDGPDLYDAADLRRLDSLLLMPGGPTSQPFAVKEGHRVNGAGLQVSVGGSPESWTVTPGPCVVTDPAYSGQGGWRVEIPNTKTGTIGARPGAGQSRIDLIVARVYDATAIGSGPAEVKIERLPGTPGSSPVAPTPPAGSITYEIARLAVPASGSITITQSVERTVAAGGILPVPTTAAMDKLETDGIAYRGLVVDNAQTDALHRFDGTDWKQLAVVEDLASDDQPWTTLTAATGWTAGTGSNKPQVKRVGTRITYKGSLYGGTLATTAAFVPDWAAPSAALSTVRVPAASASNTIGFVRVYTNGAIQPSVVLDGEAMISWDVE